MGNIGNFENVCFFMGCVIVYYDINKVKINFEKLVLRHFCNDPFKFPLNESL